MGMTLWIQTLQDGEFNQESDDHSLMNEHAEALDALCEKLDVRKLSEFFDYTDTEYNFSEDRDDEGDESDLDEETGLGYAVEDMDWFSAKEGLITLRALRDALAAGESDEFDEDERSELQAELDDCIAVLEALEDDDAQFHLELVE